MSNQKRKATYLSLPLAKADKRARGSGKTPLERHRELLACLPAAQHPKALSELDILKKNHQFLREEQPDEWEARLAQKYYDQLFKEYCLTNLSRFKTGQIALRWRTRGEVLVGKGQFSCGNLECSIIESLSSYEVNFGYIEDGVKKNALVKLRLCEKCAYKLNYKKKHSKKEKISNQVEGIQPRLESLPEEKEEHLLESQNERDVKEEETDSSFWSMKNQVRKDLELSKEEEFDKYFADLLQ